MLQRLHTAAPGAAVTMFLDCCREVHGSAPNDPPVLVGDRFGSALDCVTACCTACCPLLSVDKNGCYSTLLSAATATSWFSHPRREIFPGSTQLIETVTSPPRYCTNLRRMAMCVPCLRCSTVFLRLSELPLEAARYQQHIELRRRISHWWSYLGADPCPRLAH